MARGKVNVAIQSHPESIKDEDIEKATITTGGTPSQIARGGGQPFDKNIKQTMRPLKKVGGRKGLTF